MKLLKGIYHWLCLLPRFISLQGENDDRYLEDVKFSMDKYDMVAAPSEDYFKSRYLNIISTVTKNNFNPQAKLKVLDAGCGQGRIAIELAKKGFSVEAIDYTESTLKKGKEYAAAAGINKNQINWVKGELPNILTNYSLGSYDMVLCLEVMFMMPWPEECFKALARLVKPGGVLLVAVRPRLFYLQYYLMNKNFSSLECCAKHNNLASRGGGLSWFDPEQVRQLFLKNGFENIQKWGIGILSGIEGDPTAHFSLPACLAEKDRALLGKIEDQYSRTYINSGRYMVFAGKKGGK